MSSSRLLALAMLGAVTFGALAPIALAGFSGEDAYRFTTTFRGRGMSLDVVNGGEFNNMAHLTDTGEFSGQSWHATPSGGGYYRLTTDFRGSSMCLDIVNGGEFDKMAQLVRCANFSGQQWMIEPDEAPHRPWRALRLTTAFRGEGMCLDVINGGEFDNYVHLAPCGNFTGQYWHMTPLR